MQFLNHKVDQGEIYAVWIVSEVMDKADFQDSYIPKLSPIPVTECALISLLSVTCPTISMYLD